MKKILSLIVPIAIIFSLIGCFNPTDTVYIKKDFRKKVEFDRATGEVEDTKYEVRIDGKWYEGDENGNLTERGKRNLKNWEVHPNNPANSSDDGGGGGC